MHLHLLFFMSFQNFKLIFLQANFIRDGNNENSTHQHPVAHWVGVNTSRNFDPQVARRSRDHGYSFSDPPVGSKITSNHIPSLSSTAAGYRLPDIENDEHAIFKGITED